jgi:hypothetical protein
VAQQADGKVKEINERVNKGIETSFQMLFDGHWVDEFICKRIRF